MANKISIFILLMISFARINGQTSSYAITNKSESGIPVFIEFNNGSIVSHDNFREILHNEFRFRDEDKLLLIETHKDDIDFTHYKYNQTYKDVPLYGIQYIIHEKDHLAVTANGKFIPELNIDIIPLISEEEAKFRLYEIEGNFDCKSEEANGSSDKSKYLQKLRNTEPELCIVPYNGNYKSGEFFLCWKFNYIDERKNKIWRIFIDAHNGKIIHKINLINDQDFPGTTVTKYNGTKSISSYFNGSNLYYLSEMGTRGPTGTQQIQAISNYGNFTNPTPYFTSDQEAGSVFWAMEQTYDFYFNTFNRNSIDDAGMIMTGCVHDQSLPTNAYWDGMNAYFGDGDGIEYGALVSLDVVGHEFSHGVTQYSCCLDYFSESGALNESFSDIMGEAVEHFALGTNDWLAGNSIVLIPPYFIRSFIHPNQGTQPDTYYGNYWDYMEEVHTNSGVGNYWFYLLANGGSGTNDNGDYYNLNGIGMQDALKILYRNHTQYLTPYSYYYDAVLGSVQSAIDLFGANSPKVKSVEYAWCAVGLYDKPCYDDTFITDFKEASKSISIFPNPSTGIFTVELPTDQAQIMVTDMIGQQVIKTETTQKIVNLQLERNGVYIVYITTKQGTTAQKLVKQ